MIRGRRSEAVKRLGDGVSRRLGEGETEPEIGDYLLPALEAILLHTVTAAIVFTTYEL